MLASEFLLLADAGLMDHVQYRIENTKSKCPTCFFKKLGNEKLNWLCEQLKEKNKITV